MAYINVAEWSPDQVTDWLKGLDDSMYNYIYSFTNNEVGGKQLLNIRPYELEQLGMYSIGHQEIVLEAVEHLRNFHNNLDKENLQFLALQVATTARNLYKQLAYYNDKSMIETQILNDITRTIATIKPVISWLDRSPFHGQLQFNEIRKNMLRLGLEMATSAHRDRFVENPVDQIRMTAEKLAMLADYIIQDITDPMLLQPSSLNLITLKKRESDFGFNILPSYHGINRISDIKYNSPAHNTGKIEDGDEIVQINYQTVVGWQYKTVILQLRESPPDVLLTLKKRPKHTKIYGQIYMQPYRLPSKKRTLPGRWNDNQINQRTDILAIQDFTLPLKVNEKQQISSDTDSSCSDILTPTDPKCDEKEIRLYLPKPRAVLQRRNTICGEELSNLKYIGNVGFWHERKSKENGESISPNLRDKSVSFGYGLEISSRPTTCLGILSNNKYNDTQNINNSLPEIITKDKCNNDCNATNIEKSKAGISKVVRFDANMKSNDYLISNKYMCNVENTILETFEPIPYADEDEIILENIKTKKVNNCENLKITENSEILQFTNVSLVNRRGRLDKSHSTPAYDNSAQESTEDCPPAIEPRKEFLLNLPPAPPPRPRRQSDNPSIAPIPPPKPTVTTVNNEKIRNQFEKPSPTSNNIPISIHFLQDTTAEESELVTPTKTKNLTIKKKNILLAKRRKVNLKILGISDIQGHLYRRTKDKRGVTFWARLYFVLIETVLYGFRNKDAQKANCMIFLPGFTVSIAKEVHSKSFAFKVYHPSKTFYFAAESIEALNQWIEFIRQATLKEKLLSADLNGDHNIKEFFSETDSSEDENDLKNLIHASSITINTGNYDIRDIKTVDTPVLTTSSRHEKYLGSLKRFTKSSLQFKNSEKKPSSDIPVPTSSFRSYRKVPGGSCGIQIGINTSPYNQQNDLSSSQTSVFNQDHKETFNSINSGESKIKNSDHKENLQQNLTNIIEKPKRMRKTSPYNYIHASNPNLVEFDFQTSKTLDFSLPKINSSNAWDAHNNLQGFVTLKDLMLQKQEEEAQEMYNNRVLLGVEKKDERHLINKNKNGHFDNYHKTGKVKLAKIQSRSLPKTPDYEMSFKPDDEDIKRMRTKEGLKLRDFGYEFIYGDDPSTANNSNRNKDKINANILQQLNKKNSNINILEIGLTEKGIRSGSFKKTKGKFEAFKNSSEKLFQFKYSNNEIDKNFKSTTSYNPMTLPLNKKSNQINTTATTSTQCNIKKSHTINSDLKDKKLDITTTHRKNSAPAPIFAKLTFTTKTINERKLLGSPRLHRAIFGRNNSSGSQQSNLDHEIFSPISFGKMSSSSHELSNDSSLSTTQSGKSNSNVTATTTTTSSQTTPEYPNLECPPVFEAETYSISDPHTSLTLLRRRNNVNNL